MISIGDGKGNIIEVDFYVDENSILQPLGLLVTRDSRYELLPATRDNTEEIPGMHGEYDFGTELKARNLELEVITDEGLTPFEKSNLQRLFAKYLNPTKGIKTLVFADDIQKLYRVKYSGKIQPDFYATWFKFVIPFKMSNPFIIGTFEKSLTGSGTLINEGSFETGLTVEIAGPVTNPSITIGADILTYTGSLLEGEALILDTLKQTAKIGNINAIDNYNGVFPLLYPDTELSVVASSNVTIKWNDKFI